MERVVVRIVEPATAYPRATTAMRLPVVAGLLLGGGAFALGAAALVADGGLVGIGLGVAIALLLLLGLATVGTFLFQPRRDRLEVVTEEGRLWLPAARPLGVLNLAGLVVCVTLGLVVVAGYAVTREFEGPVAASVGAVVLAVVCVRVLVATLRGDSVLPAVGLGPDDVVRRSGRSRQVLRWEDIAEVTLETDAGPRVVLRGRRPVTTRLTSQPTLGERPVAGSSTRTDQISIGANLHGSDPRLIARLIRHYQRHPADRIELGTSRAEIRLKEGDLDGGAPGRRTGGSARGR
ncbi:hypothetical protein Cpa01nite_18310 [Cellulomonas pakistanensis]|uniref:PH domain-containing protein n=2 Tax=Cellulomonas pakistanensis TaxID=992287 RepID=A0A919P8S7_9CELL|nr:hypothetical protein Cpa01nite_18310 [Cellulomonas pakistanensis]